MPPPALLLGCSCVTSSTAPSRATSSRSPGGRHTRMSAARGGSEGPGVCEMRKVAERAGRGRTGELRKKDEIFSNNVFLSARAHVDYEETGSRTPIERQ